MKTTVLVIPKHDSITLKVTNPNFTYRLNRGSESCSGDITEATFSNISKHVNGFANYLDAFNALKDLDVLNALIVAPKKIDIGQVVEFSIGKKKTVTGTVKSEGKTYFVVDVVGMGIVHVQKSMLL